MPRGFLTIAGICLFPLCLLMGGEIEEKSGVAVVELFTSEGCSSCPPADRFLAELDRKNVPNTYFLAFHVDYWDYLGWRDRYADPAFSKRQRGYVRLLGEPPYTPQMIVNGKAVLVGSDRARARQAIGEALQTEAPLSLRVKTEKVSGGRVVIAYTVSGPRPDALHLNLGIVESGLNSRVTRGENAGRGLGHARVVRAFKTLTLDARTEGRVALAFPNDLKPENAAIVIYAQDARAGRVLGAAETAFPR